MKEKLTHQQQLAKRKYHKPWGIVVWIYHFVMANLIAPKYRPHYTVIDDINKCEGPCFLIWNHLSRLDHIYAMKLAYPRPINIMAGYSEFFRSHLHTVFKLNNILPKKVFTPDTLSTRAMISIIKQNGCIAFAPEGMSSIYGTNQPIVAGTGSLLKHFNIPVYYMELRGQYLTATKICLDEHYARTEASIRLLYSPKDLDKKTPAEIDDEINLLFKHDEYEWAKEKQLTWTKHKNMTKQFSNMLYKCPKCGAEFSMKEDNNSYCCTQCGNGITVDEHYVFQPLHEGDTFPESPSKWIRWQRSLIIKEIREDPDYSYSVKVKLGYIPPFKWVKKPATSTICGEGTFTVDHQGVHFDGTKLGEPFHFDMNYDQVFSLIIMTDSNAYGLYPGGEYHEFIPIEPTTGKTLLVTEEMHRLHVNTWKNFPWEADLYK